MESFGRSGACSAVMAVVAVIITLAVIPRAHAQALNDVRGARAFSGSSADAGLKAPPSSVTAPSTLNNSNITKPAALSAAVAPNLNSAASQAAGSATVAGNSLKAGSYPSMIAPLMSGQKNAEAEKAELDAMLRHLSARERHKYWVAAGKFPAFCQDWQQKLHEREVNNLSHLKFQERDGWETATYTGYGPVQTCVCKETREGVPIGKVTYKEYSYYLTGRTIDQAAHAKPQIVHTTETLEIFSWDKNRWFY
jgi:hypothetical protein